MEMTMVLSIVAMVMSLASIAITYRLRSRRKQQEQKLIRVPMVKINFHPVNVRWEWSRLNPKTRTWEWLGVEATIEEIEKYKDMHLSETEGFNVLYGRLGEIKENSNG